MAKRIHVLHSNIADEPPGVHLRSLIEHFEVIAEKLGISRAAVYRLERGEIVKLDTLERLAKLLRVSINSLTGSDSEYFPTALAQY